MPTTDHPTTEQMMTRDELMEIREEALAAAAELRDVGFHGAAAGQDDIARAAERELAAMDAAGDDQ